MTEAAARRWRINWTTDEGVPGDRAASVSGPMVEVGQEVEVVAEPVPIEQDAAYWRKMYEERVAIEDQGFGVVLAERDALQAEVERLKGIVALEQQARTKASADFRAERARVERLQGEVELLRALLAEAERIRDVAAGR